MKTAAIRAIRVSGFNRYYTNNVRLRGLKNNKINFQAGAWEPKSRGSASLGNMEAEPPDLPRLETWRQSLRICVTRLEPSNE